MHVAVLGGGAMGSLFAGRFALSETAVTVVDRSPEQVAALRSGLTLVETDGSRVEVPVPATTDPRAAGSADLLLVCVKSDDTAAAVRAAGPREEALALTLQNGLGNAEAVAETVPEERVLAGTTAHGATLEEPGVVRHAGSGPTRVGAYFRENDAAVDRVADLLRRAGFDTEVVAAARDAVWEKVLVNAGLNAATALARVPNGRLADTGPGRRLVERSVREAARVARAEGRSVPDDVVERTLEVAQATATNVSSMRADVERGSRTEVEALNGAIVERAARHDVPVPVNRTLTDLVRLSESGVGTASHPESRASNTSKSASGAADDDPEDGSDADDGSTDDSDGRGQP